MSLALIQESAKEVRRLAIAGSPLAVGDFRLKKLAAPLEQAGAKVPVFAQVAKAINDVVNGKEADSAANLLNLSTLLNAILYTQGQSSAEGEMRELETFASNSTSTRTPARLLKPLVQALTSTGSGRFEIVKSAVERGAFNDLRLIDPAIHALGDVYPELADLVTEKILPGYGPGIVPLLKSGLDLKGKKSDARRLQIMHELDPAGTLPLCNTALEDGSPEVKVAAIACLGKHEDCLPLVLEQANAKNKQLRAAALEALAEHDRPEVTKLFTELVKGKALDILAGPFRKLQNKQVVRSLLDEGQRVFDLLLNGDSEHIARFIEILDCLKERKDSEIEDFMLARFAQCEKLPKFKPPKKSPFVVHTTGEDIADRMVWLLYEIGTPKALEAVLAKRDVLPPSAFHHVLY
nr:HEAT repeat domain-containing protein [Verrucomicrobiota bacterium]